MSSLKIQSYPHKKTGKSFITEAKLPLAFKGRKVEICVFGNGVEVSVDGVFGQTFKRDVPMLQILYYIQNWIDSNPTLSEGN